MGPLSCGCASACCRETERQGAETDRTLNGGAEIGALRACDTGKGVLVRQLTREVGGHDTTPRPSCATCLESADCATWGWRARCGVCRPYVCMPKWLRHEFISRG